MRISEISRIFFALLVGLGLGALFLLLAGYDPLKAYFALFHGAFGSVYGICNTLSRATPLILTGLTFAIGIKGGLFNIGAQGQMIFGALGAIAASTLKISFPWHLVFALIFAMLLGALWSLPVALLKISKGIHEVISTIMLNWLAFWIANYFVINTLSDPVRGERSIVASPSARFGSIIAGSDLSYAIFASIIFALIVYFFLSWTVAGYELRVAGLNPKAAKYAGINPAKGIFLALFLGGMAAGLGGATQVLGRYPYALNNGLETLATLGFDGIAVALVGHNHPLGVIAAAFFFGALAAGAGEMGFTSGAPLDSIRVVQGIIVLTLALPEIWRIMREKIWR